MFGPDGSKNQLVGVCSMARKTMNKPAVDESAADAEAAFDIDTSSEKNLTLEMMAEYEKTCENKEQLISYLFRVWPVIEQRRATGPKGQVNIDKVAGVFTRNYILSKHGSGVYKISFHDMGRPRARRRVGVLVLELHEPGVIPVCDPRTVIWSHERNQSYLAQLQTVGPLPSQALEFMAQRDGLTLPSQTVAVPVVAPVPSMSAQVAEVINTAKLLRDEMGGGGRGGGGELQTSVLLPLITTLGNMNMALFERMNQAAAAPPAAPAGGGLGHLREVMGLLQSMGWRAPGGAVVDVAADAVAPEPAAPGGGVIQALSAVASIFRDGREMFEMMRGGGAAAAAGGVGYAGGVDDGEVVENTGAAVPATQSTQGETMLKHLQEFGNMALDSFLSGEPGAAFAQRMDGDAVGRERMEKARSQGLERIKFFLDMVPGLSETVQGRGRSMAEVHAWLASALAPAPARKKGGR